MAEMKEGEKYLNIKLLDSINIAVFRNEKKTKPNEPDFVNYRAGVTVWVRQKGATKPRIKEEMI